MIFTNGEAVQFQSKTAGGFVYGEFLKLADDKGHVRITSAPAGSSYVVGNVYGIPIGKLESFDVEIVERPAASKPKPTTETAAAKPRRKINRPLVDEYRPARLADVRGQDEAIETLSAYAVEPYPQSFILSGPTGTGKTSAAKALANELGVSVENAEFGGLYEIASGEQNGEAVREAIRKCHTRPMIGSGWKVLIVNEADCMTSAASVIWLDVLEKIPPSTTIVFTTNDIGKIPQRLRDRSVEMEFNGTADVLRNSLQSLASEVWLDVTGKNDCPPVESFGGFEDRNGEVSFRRLLQKMEPFVRTGRRPAGSAIAA